MTAPLFYGSWNYSDPEAVLRTAHRKYYLSLQEVRAMCVYYENHGKPGELDKWKEFIGKRYPDHGYRFAK